MSRRWLRLLAFFALGAALSVSVFCEGNSYPWVHHFRKPDKRLIHTAFPDADGSIIVATGDWTDYQSIPGYYIWEYSSSGVYRIDCGNVEHLPFPEQPFVFDGAVDSQSRTWLLFGEGQDDWDRQNAMVP